MDVDRPSLAAAALYDLKNEQLQLANAALQQQQQQQQQQHMSADRNSQEASNNAKNQEANAASSADSATTDQPVTTSAGAQQMGEESENDNERHACGRMPSLRLVTEMGPEIPFELGQFLLYKGHFLNLLHFPIWKVHTKTLLLKYDTVLADSEIAWEATDEVRDTAHLPSHSSIHRFSMAGNVLYQCLR